MSKTYKDALPRNNSFEALRKRRAGTGGSGAMKSRNAPRGGQANQQRAYLDEYLDERADTDGYASADESN